MNCDLQTREYVYFNASTLSLLGASLRYIRQHDDARLYRKRHRLASVDAA